MHALGNFNLRDNFRVLRVFHVKNRRAMRRIHVTDECIAVLDDDLPAPRYVGSADQFYIFRIPN